MEFAFLQPGQVRKVGRELEIMVNGDSPQVLERIKSLGPEAVSMEALSLEEIFVTTMN